MKSFQRNAAISMAKGLEALDKPAQAAFIYQLAASHCPVWRWRLRRELEGKAWDLFVQVEFPRSTLPPDKILLFPRRP